jgi:PAS domain S-box-containing protein
MRLNQPADTSGSRLVSSSTEDRVTTEPTPRSRTNGQDSWDIPLTEEFEVPSRIPGPAPQNNPRIETYARLLAAGGAAFLALAFVVFLFLADTETVMSLFFSGGITVSNAGAMKIAGFTALGVIVAGLALHPMMREFILSKVGPRVLEPEQRAIVEMIPSPIFFLNSEAKLEDVNSTFARMVGHSAASIIGRSIYDFIPDDVQDTAYQALIKVSAGEQEGFRCPVLTDLGTRMFYIHAEPYQGHNAESPHIIGIALDITEEVAASEAVETRYRSLRHAALQTLDTLAHVVETRDPYLSGHHDRVAKLAGQMADDLGLSDDEKEGIEIAARAHDIGTIRIPFEIQVKPEPLSEAECAIIQEHAQFGADLLSRISFPWPVAEIVAQHHEFYDGSGYPNGLRRDKINIGARIIAVADAYDALTSQRPYRTAINRSEALQRLIRLGGQHYDPAVVNALSRVLQRTASRLEEERPGRL